MQMPDCALRNGRTVVASITRMTLRLPALKRKDRNSGHLGHFLALNNKATVFTAKRSASLLDCLDGLSLPPRFEGMQTPIDRNQLNDD